MTDWPTKILDITAAALAEINARPVEWEGPSLSRKERAEIEALRSIESICRGQVESARIRGEK